MTSLVRKLKALLSSNHTAQQQQKPEADDEGEPVVATDPEAQGCDAKREKEDTETTRAEKEDTVNNKGEEEGTQAGDSSSLRAGSSISDATDKAGEGEKKASAEEDEPQPAQPNVAKRTKKKKKVTVQTTTDGTKRANNESDEKKATAAEQRERRPTLVGRLRTHSLANIFKLVSSEPAAEQQGAPLDPADAEGPPERDGLLFKEGTFLFPLGSPYRGGGRSSCC